MPRRTLPPSGAVLGVDVGFSASRPSSAWCRLEWTPDEITLTGELFCTDASEAALLRAADRPLCAAAFDGPLREGFGEIGRYRLAEKILTRGFAARIGKPGASHVPVGRALNRAANRYVQAVLASGQVADAHHDHRIAERAVAEAFPTAWLGMLLPDPHNLKVKRGNRSDVFYAALAEGGALDQALAHFLPGRRLATPFAAVTKHDSRAAAVCALTALGAAAGDYVAAGDRDDGWIILPPRPLVQPWAWAILTANASSEGGLAWTAPPAPGTA